MSKMLCVIGYATTEETVPGVFEEKIKPMAYYADLIRNTSKYQSTANLNDDISLNNSISIIADPYAFENYAHMRYVDIHGTKWKISDAELAYPRIILNVGGVYNDKTR